MREAAGLDGEDEEREAESSSERHVHEKLQAEKISARRLQRICGKCASCAAAREEQEEDEEDGVRTDVAVRWMVVELRSGERDASIYASNERVSSRSAGDDDLSPIPRSIGSKRSGRTAISWSSLTAGSSGSRAHMPVNSRLPCGARTFIRGSIVARPWPVRLTQGRDVR